MEKLGRMLIIAVAIGVGVFVAIQKNSRRDVERNLESKSREFAFKAQALLQRQMAGEDVSDEQMKIFDEFLAEAEKSGDQLGGRDAKAMRAMVIALRDVQPALKEYDTALKGVMALGELSAATMKVKDDVVKRRAVVKKMGDANDALDKAFASVPDTLVKRLGEAGISASDTSKFVNEFKSSGNLSVVAQVRACDREMFQAMDKQLAMIENNWGKWEAMPDGAFDFKNDALNNEFNKHFEEMDAAIKRQERIQQQAISKMTSQFGK